MFLIVLFNWISYLFQNIKDPMINSSSFTFSFFLLFLFLLNQILLWFIILLNHQYWERFQLHFLLYLSFYQSNYKLCFASFILHNLFFILFYFDILFSVNLVGAQAVLFHPVRFCQTVRPASAILLFPLILYTACFP